MGKTLYEILGVKSGAGNEAIKKGYRAKMRKHHPDTGDGDRTELALAQKAYDILSSPDKRKRYDISLKAIEVETVEPPVRDTKNVHTPPSQTSSSSFYWNSANYSVSAGVSAGVSSGSSYVAYYPPVKSTVSIRVDDVVNKGLTGLSAGQRVYITQIGTMFGKYNISISTSSVQGTTQYIGTIIHASYGISPGRPAWGEFEIELD